MSILDGRDPNCLHCVLAQSLVRFHAEHPDYGGVAMVSDVVSLLVELICQGTVNTTADPQTQRQVCERVQHVACSIVPARVAAAMPEFQAAQKKRCTAK